jgi:hypothetical protein
MPERETQESAAKYFRHPGWKLLAVFMQYVVGPGVVAIITSYGIYLTNIQSQVKDDVRRVMDVREVVSDYIEESEPAPAEATAPVVEPPPPIVAAPPKLFEKWEALKGAGVEIPIEDLKNEYQQQMKKK